MLDDIFDLIILIAEGIFDFFHIGWKEKKERKNAGKKQKKNSGKLTEKDLCKGVFLHG